MMRASSVRSSLRWTMRSTKPCCSRNSLVWKPFGQLQAHGVPDGALAGEADQRAGSARVMSPCMAKLAATPPIVGLVKIETYRPPAWS